MGIQINQMDPTAVIADLDRQSAARIKDAFGRDISLSALIGLLARFSAGSLSDQELVDVIEMGIYFARVKMEWAEAAANLEYWLVAGNDAAPQRVMKAALIRDLDNIESALCGKHYEDIVAGVSNRLHAVGELFPKEPDIITGASGEAIFLTPAESPLTAGGEEVLYKQSSVLTTGERGDIYNAVGAVTLVSRVTVRSERLQAGGWQVAIVDWECWFWDAYDWNKDVGVSIPVHLFDRLGVPAEYRPTLENALALTGINKDVLEEIKVQDETMKQIEGKTIAMPDGRQMKPKSYLIYGDSSWRFDSGAFCDGKPMTFTVT
ncbi:MAG: hypothetical protein ABL971_05330 [Vicinamibacterales bacterium]